MNPPPVRQSKDNLSGLCIYREDISSKNNTVLVRDPGNMGGCMLVEDTAEHRDLFGPDGDAVVYFSSPDDAVARTRELVADSARRRRLALRVRELIGRPEHTYAARLREMLRHAAASRDAARVAS